jgi:hypothetical protein
MNNTPVGDSSSETYSPRFNMNKNNNKEYIEHSDIDNVPHF